MLKNHANCDKSTRYPHKKQEILHCRVFPVFLAISIYASGLIAYVSV